MPSRSEFISSSAPAVALAAFPGYAQSSAARSGNALPAKPLKIIGLEEHVALPSLEATW